MSVFFLNWRLVWFGFMLVRFASLGSQSHFWDAVRAYGCE